MGLNSGVMMKMLATTLAAALLLCSCGPCNGCGYNSDYLRDVNISSSKLFE